MRCLVDPRIEQGHPLASAHEEVGDGDAGAPDGADGALHGVRGILRPGDEVEDGERDDEHDGDALDELHGEGSLQVDDGERSPGAQPCSLYREHAIIAGRRAVIQRIRGAARAHPVDTGRRALHDCGQHHG